MVPMIKRKTHSVHKPEFACVCNVFTIYLHFDTDPSTGLVCRIHNYNSDREALLSSSVRSATCIA
ncbi:hypothetical protein Ancab_019281, partial [Ancistrocladus abbreviatus]